jgi:hypothetical protein
MDQRNGGLGGRNDSGEALAAILDETRELAALRLALRPEDPGPPGLDWLAPTNLAAIRIEPDGDGWRCDVDLTGLGSWQPDCIGAPDPFPDRDGALAYARSLVGDVVLASALRVRLPPATWPLVKDPESFSFDGLAVPLHPGTVLALRRCGAPLIRRAYVERRLSETRTAVFGDGPATRESFLSLPALSRRAFEHVCAIAALNGIQRWPDLQVVGPGSGGAHPGFRLVG